MHCDSLLIKLSTKSGMKMYDKKLNIIKCFWKVIIKQSETQKSQQQSTEVMCVGGIANIKYEREISDLEGNHATKDT